MPPPTAATTATPDFVTSTDALPAPAPGTPPVPAISIHVSLRSPKLTIVAIVLVVAALALAQTFVVSLLLGILAAYTLNPLVIQLEKLRIPRVAGTAVVMVSVLGALALGVHGLRGQPQAIIEQLPEAAKTFSDALERLRAEPGGNLQMMQSTAKEVEAATARATGDSPAKRAATHVVVDAPGFKLGNMLRAGSMGAAEFLGQATMVLFPTFLLLLGVRHGADDRTHRQDEFRRRLDCAAVLRLSLGCVGHAAGHSDRGHRQGRGRTRRAAATGGGVAGGMMGRGLARRDASRGRGMPA